MSHSSQLQAVLYNTEASYCENLSTFSTALPLLDIVGLEGLARQKVRIPHIKQYAQEGYLSQLAPFEGQKITLKGRLTGMGATCAGAVPTSDLWVFLGHLLGVTTNGLATGGTFTGGTAAAPTTSMASGAAGALVHGGAVADGRAGGQWIAVNTHSASTLTPFIALPAAPNNGDVLYSSKVMYPKEDPGETPNTVRLEVLTTNQHFILRGCYVPRKGFRVVGSMPGGILDWELDLVPSHVTTTTATFPSATVPQRHAAGPAMVNGSVAIQEVGVTTRVAYTVRDLSLDFDIGGDGLKGPVSTFDGQLYTGCRRVPGENSLVISMTVDAEATGTQTWRDRFDADPNTAGKYWQVLLSILVHDGRAIGLYAGRCELADVQPIQMSHDGFNRERLIFRALTRTTESSEQRRASWMFGAA